MINASGCGTTVKDYGFMFRDDPGLAAQAAADRPRSRATSPSSWPRSACKRRGEADRACASPTTAPARCSTGSASATSRRRCCRPAGFVVLDPPEGISAAARPAPTISCSRRSRRRLRDRKVANIESVSPDVVAAGNIGCMTQIASGTRSAGRPHGRAAGLGDGRTEAVEAGRDVSCFTKLRIGAGVGGRRERLL